MAKKNAGKGGTDSKRVSMQKHEVAYTGGKVAKATGASKKAGKKAVVKAKKQTGKVSRETVEKKAADIV